jgi:hypothetical protein
MMFCQWCGNERAVDALAIHHCGPKERPPAYCMGCGHTFEAGATECSVCHTAVGQLPKAPVVARAAEEPMGAVSGDAAGPVGAVAVPASPAAVAATAPSRYSGSSTLRRAPDEVDGYAKGLAKVMLWAALIGTGGFFIGWGFGSSGITVVELEPTKWWDVTSANILFAFMLVALVLCVFAVLGSEGTWIFASITLMGALTSVICCEYIWRLQSVLSVITGFWIVAAASFALFIAGMLATMHARQS